MRWPVKRNKSSKPLVELGGLSIAFWLGIALLSGWACTPPGTGTGWTLVDRSAPRRPGWITRKPERPEVFFAVGVATGARSLEEGIERAAREAAADVARYVEQRARVCYVESREPWVRRIQSWLDVRSSSSVSGGTWNELYYERWRQKAWPRRERYDVYLLYAVPSEDIERSRQAQRERLREARERVRERLEQMRWEAPRSLTLDFGEALAELRVLEEMEPDGELVARATEALAGLLERLQLRVFLGAAEPRDPLVRSVVVEARARGTDGFGRWNARPVAGLPLEIRAESPTGSARWLVKTDRAGRAWGRVALPRAGGSGGPLEVQVRPYLVFGERPPGGTPWAEPCPASAVAQVLARAAMASPPVREVFWEAQASGQKRALERSAPRVRWRVLRGPVGRSGVGAGFRTAYLLWAHVPGRARAESGRPLRRLVLGLDASLARNRRWARAVAGAVRALFEESGPDGSAEIITSDREYRVLLDATPSSFPRTAVARLRWLGGRYGDEPIGELVQRVAEATARATAQEVQPVLLVESRHAEAALEACGAAKWTPPARPPVLLVAGFAGRGGWREGVGNTGTIAATVDATGLAGLVRAALGGGLRGQAPVNARLQLAEGMHLGRVDGAEVRLERDAIVLRAGWAAPGSSRVVYVEVEGVCPEERASSRAVKLDTGPRGELEMWVPCPAGTSELDRGGPGLRGDPRVTAYGALLEALDALARAPAPVGRTEETRRWLALWVERVGEARRLLDGETVPADLEDLSYAVETELRRVQARLGVPAGERWWRGDPEYLEGLSRRLRWLEPAGPPAPP